MQVKGAFGCLPKEGKLLLIKNRYNPNWFFPGGEIEEGEKPRETVERELKEELNIGVNVLKLINHTKVSHFSHKYNEKSHYIIYHFLCETGDEPMKGEDVIEEISYFSPKELKKVKTTDDVIETAEKISKIE